MPRIMELKAPDGSIYNICSMYEDTIEKEPPAIWFGAYSFSLLTQIGGYPKDVARKMSIEWLKEWINTPCPEYLLALYDSNNKREQEKLLREQSINPENLITWLLIGGSKGGLFSQYAYDAGVPEDMKGRTPMMIDASKQDHITTIGKTDLSESALRHLVENQTRVIAQFIDFNDGRWYCFYRTFRGLSGRESSKHGQHMHFISSAYGLDREKLIDEIKKGKCPTNGYHVHLTGYRDEEV